MDQARKVRVCITNEQNPNDSKSSMHFLKWIQLDGGDVIYEFPPEFQQLNSKHRTLLQIPTVKSVLKTLTRRGSYRIIAITLPATTVPLYFDDNGNSVFEEYYLEEKDLQKWKSETYPVPTGQGPSQLSSEAQNAAILEILQKLTATTEEPQPQRMEGTKRLNLTKIKSDFVLENFDGKNFEVGRWLDIFIRECDRCQVANSEDKILILRLFMDGIAKNWYSSTLSDLGLDKNFTDWETKMREAFKEHGWKKIREAYNFRYIGGPYVDYVLRKQSLLLEQEHTIDKTVQINLIVTGLPVHVQDKLDRSKIDSIEQLLGELRKIEPPPQKKNLPDTETHPRKVFTPAANYEQKKSCSICNKLGYPGRFHPEALCRNRSSAEHKGKHIKTKKAIYLECLAMKEAIKFWQHWLVGATFQIITDHKPLEALKINSRSDEELGDMLLFLSQFDFRVTYRPGSTNMEADCLSRNPVIEDYEYLEEFVKTVNFLTLSDITTDQENHSSEFNKIGNTRKESGIIYKIKNTTKRIVISESLADALIKKVHLDFGHIGSAHVIKKIRQFYYTKNLDSKVKAYCQSCELCIKNKTRNSSSYGYLSQLGPARAPFEIVSLDTIGGFAGNRSSKRYLHLLVDHFTRYAFISTSKNQTADDFVKLIKKVQDKHQIKTLLTDQYSGINSAEFKSYLKREGINLIFTAVNNPASNGLNERLNQTLVNRIRCKINSSHGRAWSRIAEECVQEYNSTDHSVTTFSPEYLLFGKTSPIVPNSLEPKSDIIRDREAAFENTIKNHNYNKRLYDRNRRHHDFKEGDLVYVDHSSKIQRNKLEEIRIGPLKITKKISNSIFELDTGHRKKESNMFHVSKLVPVPVGGGI
ncbi:unnamed protein product [Nesidiocoris tenuis]|uniref:RNA-directed DNA polymerase n=1 Tax=Nesidiocoris tenuis TaxID=355587 RepID=A0A6H5GFP5_9HEMI|nr:unnamed protein product [Nesidiocoris tenuis]